MIVWIALAAGGLSLVISLLATPLSRRVAVRFGMLDVPGRHKAHDRPVPLLGGSAIFAAVLGPSLLALALARYWSATGIPGVFENLDLAPYIHGAAMRTPMALGILLGALALHVMGIVDDRLHLGAWSKLAVQIAVATAVVVGCDVRVMTMWGAPISIILTVLWVVAITNAFNFLDNMDGLSAGVAAIIAAALLGAAASVGQLFVSAWCCLILGAMLGFLPYSFPPAGVYMGDGGSLVIGFLLAVASVLTTYVRPSEPHGLYGVFVPLVLMAVPIYDTISVIVLRLRDGVSPMIGDRRHFSHRLLRRGMSVRAAVLTVYLCTAGTAVAATLLTHVRDDAGAWLVLGQTAVILLIIAVLESGDTRATR